MLAIFAIPDPSISDNFPSWLLPSEVTLHLVSSYPPQWAFFLPHPPLFHSLSHRRWAQENVPTCQTQSRDHVPGEVPELAGPSGKPELDLETAVLSDFSLGKCQVDAH